MSFSSFVEQLTVYPAGFQDSGTGPNSIVLQWNAIDFEELEGYVLHYHQGNNSSVANNENTTVLYIHTCNTSLEVFNLEPSTNYSFQIAGVTGYEIGPRSPPITVETQRQRKLLKFAILFDWLFALNPFEQQPTY